MGSSPGTLDLPSENDFITIQPGETATIDAACAAPFWWYLRDKEYDARAFEVSYSFYEPEIEVPRKHADEHRRKLASVKRAFCSLLRADPTSSRVVIDWSRYTPDAP